MHNHDKLAAYLAKCENCIRQAFNDGGGGSDNVGIYFIYVARRDFWT